MSNYTSALEIAVKRAGGQLALARKIGAKQQNVWDWLNKGNRKVSPRFAAAIEAATGVSKHDLRPDIFGPRPTSKSESEIIALFERYGFQDALGHPLIHCLDFLALVVLATQQRTQA